MTNVEFYSEIGNGRESPKYQTTTTFKGRLKGTIEFVAAKTVDKIRIEEITHGLEIQNQLEHENITRFINWFQSDSKLVIILEYCPGGTLLDLLQRDVYLPESVIRIFAADLLSALVYLHANSFLFRDFDPRNILLDENGILKLNDFTGAGNIGEKIDVSHVFPESFCYLAPELLGDDGIPSFASDLYSLGCLMYKMATGFTPFDNDEQKDILENIRTLKPLPISICSKEFNDLVLKLLTKDPYKRPDWIQVARHPFWRDFLDPDYFEDIEHTIFPQQPEFEAKRPKNSGQSFTDFPLSMSLSLSLRQSCFLHQEKKLQEEKQEKELTQSIQPQSFIEKIRENILKSEILKPVPIIYNATIEEIQLSSIDGASIPVDSAMLHAQTQDDFERAATKIKQNFEGLDRVKAKQPLLSFLTQHAKYNDVANNFVRSPFFLELLVFASQTKHPQLASAFLLLFATIIRNATEIPPSAIQPEKLCVLEELEKSQQESVARKAVAALGEVVSFVSQQKAENTNYKFPIFTTRVLLDALHSQDDITRHYAVRTVANLLTSPRINEVFELQTLESVLMNFSVSDDSPLLMESYSIAITLLYQLISKPASMDFVSLITRSLISKTNPTLQLLSVILAVETDSLIGIKEDLLKCFRNSCGETRIKGLLAICLLADKEPEDMLEVSARFFGSFDKVQMEQTSIYDTLVHWSASKCEQILDLVIHTSKPLQLLQIPLDAISNKPIVTKIWTQSFGKKVQKLVRDNNFSAQNCELILQIVHQGVAFGVCDISIIADLGRPLNSQKESVRFSAVKIIADSCENEVSEPIIKFTESTIIPLAPSLLQDQSIIPDQTLRILSKVSKKKESIVHSLTKTAILNTVFQRAPDNPFALDLASLIVKEGNLTIETLVSARLIQCIMNTMDKTTGAIDLLMQTLLLTDKQIQGMTAANQKKLIKSISTIAAKAPICAATILENELSGPCFNLMIKLFTPQGTQNDILIDSAFGPFSIALTNGYKKQEYAQVLSLTIQALQTSAAASQAMRLRLKGATALMAAIRKASTNGVSPLKEAATSALKTLKG